MLYELHGNSGTSNISEVGLIISTAAEGITGLKEALSWKERGLQGCVCTVVSMHTVLYKDSVLLYSTVLFPCMFCYVIYLHI